MSNNQYQQSRIGAFPSDWILGKLEKLTSKIGSGITPRGGSKTYLGDGIPFIRSQNVLVDNLDLSDVVYISEKQHRYMKSTHLQPFDVLLNITGASIGRCCFVPENIKEGNVNQHVCIIRATEKVNPFYLSAVLNSDIGQRQIWRFQAGGNRQGLNYQQIRSFQIPLPPLPEQCKIAEILSTWDNAIALTERLIAALQQRKKGLMQRLLTGQVRFPGFEKSKEKRETKYGIIPLDWNVKTVLELGENSKNTVQTGPFGAQLHASDYIAEGVPLILIRNIEENRINSNGIPKISQDDAIRLKRFAIRENDVVFSRVGRVGSCFLATRDHVGWIISGQTLRIRLPEGIVNFDYLSYVLQDDRAQRYIKGVSIGSTRQSISTKILESLPLVLPTIPEQERIATFLKGCDKEIDLHNQKLEALKQQKKGLMQRLLTGEVRVKV